MRYSLFFNPEQGVYGEQCNKRVVEKAMEAENKGEIACKAHARGQGLGKASLP